MLELGEVEDDHKYDLSPRLSKEMENSASQGWSIWGLRSQRGIGLGDLDSPYYRNSQRNTPLHLERHETIAQALQRDGGPARNEK